MIRRAHRTLEAFCIFSVVILLTTECINGNQPPAASSLFGSWKSDHETFLGGKMAPDLLLEIKDDGTFELSEAPVNFVNESSQGEKTEEKRTWEITDKQLEDESYVLQMRTVGSSEFPTPHTIELGIREGYNDIKLVRYLFDYNSPEKYVLRHAD
ncbi:hypothetical protein [Pseudarthrobacter sp. MEB009]|uniref:hypothetical protein n=1 Tax=Pseudarthrobacter sp. MEB009 TaxID=3040326 RepID=UPI0025567AD5|nr:hypothetical protein [Pseudarthrobacter sp. MEB009]